MMTFTSDDIRHIAEILGTEAQENDNEYFFSLTNPVTKQSLTLNICNDVDLGDGEMGALVVAQTQHGYFEVHDCTAFIVFEPDELIFICADDERISGMVVGKQCTCSMFVNVQRKNLSANFTDLDPRLLMSAMQLSVAEVMLLAE